MNELHIQMQHTYNTVEEYVEQIVSGEYKTREKVADFSHLFGKIYIKAVCEWLDIDVESVTVEGAEVDMHFLDQELYVRGLEADYGLIFEVTEHDEPTVGATPISEFPVEVVDERGRNFAVVLTVGGPYIEVVANGGDRAVLKGYWGSDEQEMYGPSLQGYELDTFLDYFIERD